jgi:hypothetical protein
MCLLPPSSGRPDYGGSKHQGFGNPFSALAGLRPWWVAPPLIPIGLHPLRTASLWFFALRACHQWRWPLGLAFAVLDTPGFYHDPGLRRNLTALEGVLPPMGLGHFRWLSPLRDTSRQCPQRLLQTRIISPLTLYRPAPSQWFLLRWYLAPQRLLLQWLYLSGQLSSTLAFNPGHPCSSTILFATLVREWPEVIIGTHFCARMAVDLISSTMTCMWYE